MHVLRLAFILLLCWLAFAVGASAWDESTQALADHLDMEGIVVAAVGGAFVTALLAFAYLVATSRRR